MPPRPTQTLLPWLLAADPVSREAFLRSHRSLVDGVVSLARRVQSDRELTNLIRRKFAIKCTTGAAPPMDGGSGRRREGELAGGWHGCGGGLPAEPSNSLWMWRRVRLRFAA